MKRWPILYKPIHPATNIGEKNTDFFKKNHLFVDFKCCSTRGKLCQMLTQRWRRMSRVLPCGGHRLGDGDSRFPSCSQGSSPPSLCCAALKITPRGKLPRWWGLLSHHKSPTGLSRGGRQLEPEEQWKPQTTYPGISNACTIRGDTRCQDLNAGTDISGKVLWFIVFIPMLELGQRPSCLKPFLLARCSFHSPLALQELSSLGWQHQHCIFYFFLDKSFHSRNIYIVIFLVFYLQVCG